MPRVTELLAEARDLPSALTSAEEAARDAEVLLCAALKKPRSYLFAWPEAEVPPPATSQFRHWLTERARGVPVAYLLGQREFWSLTLAVDETTLIPRPETELLVEQVLSVRPADESMRIADLGTGSGAIALAIASERPLWSVTAVDISAAALAVAERNRQQLALDNVNFLEGDWLAPLEGDRFDLIVANPPYLAANDPHLQEGDLPFEPRGALVSGADGLEALRRIVTDAPPYLCNQGGLLLEHGFDQGRAVRALLAEAGYSEVCSHTDLAGHERVTTGIRPGDSGASDGAS